VILGASLNDNFLSSGNITNVLARSAFIGLIAMGMTFVITQGGLDLSVGSMAAFLAGIMIMAMNALIPILGRTGAPSWLGMGVALLGGIAAGYVNGALITKARIEAFIVTLGTMGIFRSLVTWLADGGTLSLDSGLRSILPPGLFRRHRLADLADHRLRHRRRAGRMDDAPHPFWPPCRGDRVERPRRPLFRRRCRTRAAGPMSCWAPWSASPRSCMCRASARLPGPPACCGSWRRLPP
jgi:hypothetical protein